ncbi:MAG: DUF721 domain-containing protein [Acidobacteriota bacterium]|nr:MAG: DUF721 domain-containing protein [Acidobacteriota bacterium]
MEHIGKAIAKALRSLEPNPVLEKILVISAWETCAGPLLAKQTKAIGFSGERLTVAVKDETWQKHLVDLTPQLLAKLNRALGEGAVTFIEIEVDPQQFGSEEISGNRNCVDGRTAAIPDRVLSASASIESESLREAFLDLTDRMRHLEEKRVKS